MGDNDLSKYNYKSIKEFQDANPTKADKESVLSQMTDEQIDHLISMSNNIYGKIFTRRLRRIKRRVNNLF